MKTQEEVKKIMRNSKEIAEIEGYINHLKNKRKSLRANIKILNYEITDMEHLKTDKEAKLSSLLNT